MLSSCAGRIDSELFFSALWRKKCCSGLFFKLLVYLLKHLFDHLCEADLGVTCPEHMQSVIQSVHFGDRSLFIL